MSLLRAQYYLLKPYIPWRLRMVFRRWSARRRRAVCGNSWPIKQSSEKAPANWPGWPEGKEFAVVLTHDVEGPAGLAKCEAVMALEVELGFRSAFNLIPEGDYTAPDSLRREAEKRGFEIGVHDLEHDGRLYSSRKGFHAKAVRINQYLQKWGALGFRSAFMHHNLEWLHDLKIQYDASTFDTDPFEPQPDGVETIFPFWVSRQQEDQGAALEARSQNSETLSQGSDGFVELPYTLCQDSTLFLLFQESSIDIWRRKVDWIAVHGGMVLVNVHPDFACFNKHVVRWREYPVNHYASLLTYLRAQYAGRYWQALPRDMARFVSSFRPRYPHTARRRVCMITHSYYEADNRVIRYAEALAERGDVVDVLALRRNSDLSRNESIEGVNVFRVQSRPRKTEKSRLAYLFPLVRFLATSSLWITWAHHRRSYDLVHVHNLPDFLVYAAWYPKFRGAKVILDIHDIVPEFFASKFHEASDSRIVGLLKWIERISARFADHIIISNHLWLDRYVSRAASPDKCSVFINHVDARIFKPRVRARSDRKPIILFPGGLQWHQGLDVAICAFGKLIQHLPEAEFHIYGDGNMKSNLMRLVHDLGLDSKVRFFEPLSLRQIAQVMADSDLGVVPKRADSFGNEAYSTKIMEFMALGVPVVASNTKIDRYYFDDSVLRFFDSGNADKLAEAMLDILRNNEARQSLVVHASDYVKRHGWETHKQDYLNLVDRLLRRH